MSYVSNDVKNPDDPKDVIEWVRNELKRIEETFNLQSFVQLVELHVEPVRPRAGMVVFADGTDWNPGSGTGIYAYHSSAWNKLG